tara:strand:- start:75 stop:1079 length:1005 start_codon:yes stop_codon:yes gene_type:complete
MKKQIGSIYEQVKHSIDIFDDFKKTNQSYSNIIHKYDKILIIGMGGSAIGADFSRTLVEENLDIPIYVVRDYSIPNWVDEKTFIIVSSYSGNTEETLSAYNQCIEKKCFSIAISTGGKLTQIAKDRKIGVIKLPEGFQPRAAVGYSIAILLLLFVEIGLIEKKVLQDLKIISQNQLGKEYISKALEISEKLYNHFPIIYSGGGYMEVLSNRLRGQLAENSKILSYQSVFPEHNHNEIEGWSKNLEKINSNLAVIWIKDKSDSIYVDKRMEIVKDIIDQYASCQLTIEVSSESLLERVFTIINIIDWISYYLANKYEVNPSPVKNISKLKSLMIK